MSTSPAMFPAPPEPGRTPADMIGRAVDLRADLIAEQAEVENRTYYSAEMHERFMDAGFYRIMVPKRYGGYEFDFPTFARLLVELGRGCVSTAWCLGLASAHSLQVGSYFEKAAQDEIFGDGSFRAASVAAPTVVAKDVEDAWELSGTVAYCSGIPYSTHFVGQAVPEGVPPQEVEDRLMLFVAPRGVWTMLDDWGDILGLKGSGSQSIRFDGGRIPKHWAIENTHMIDVDVSNGTPGYALHGNPLYCGRALGPFTITLAAVTVGGGYNALDAYEEHLRTRVTQVRPFGPRLTDPDYQRWYGSALARLATAEAALLRCVDEHMELCERNASGGPPYSPEDEHRVAAVAREIVIQVWETVEQVLFRTVGSGVLRSGSRFERVFRDLSIVASHRNTAGRDGLARRLGQLHLGLE
jgi:3-hydroxy-9,10-secoandrosta-1,3,5(10)-triene-9,17-dione monooxygenase